VKNSSIGFGSNLEAVMYPLLLLILMWSVYLLEMIAPFSLTSWGILPKTLTGLKGIIFSPLLHSPNDIMHVVNNSFPTAILLGALVYFYKSIAGKVFFLSWIITGLLVWLIAENKGSYHIGMSGVVYALASFLFVSGKIRNYLPLQGISLFVAFVYGSLIWGVFPTEERISWEGHLFGLLTGIALALFYKKSGPQAPKYQYEIEPEMMKIHILRHAKTDQNAHSGKDFDRKLLPRGLAQSEMMNVYLSNKNFLHTDIYCSTAQRTRETFDIVTQRLNFNSYHFSDELYLSPLNQLLNFINKIGHKNDIFIIGHNDGISDLASYLSGDLHHLQTSGYICFDVPIKNWNELTKACGIQTDFYRPTI
jgi:phosphohistidine phosphatase SixA/membrane associated rhomboid family serine protease